MAINDYHRRVQRGSWEEQSDTQVLGLPPQGVFVDHRGSRRRLLAALGVLVAVTLTAWLAIIVVSVVIAAAPS
ncbi:hypothetical protein BG844_28955 [Couchioplanes caeruleus subsp. caeruleus]|uniref:Uncharacterized protein n=1 Tax=Couchioplanes caeruleus subsp. caeruleus TaxID=56427 RepID=A0A1K0GJA2_9ACTN|nr:hypothetical protein BG844_28955 [Couchioplanes caeruleus subsp. caeruleus]